MDHVTDSPACAVPGTQPATNPPLANSTPMTAATAGEQRAQGPDRRKSNVDRRTGIDRRIQSCDETGYTGPERRSGERRDSTGLERRRGPGRRRSDDRKAAEEGEMTIEQFEFVMAVQTYKKVNKRLYPTWTEILEIIHQLGYRKICPRQIKLDNVPEPELLKPE